MPEAGICPACRSAHLVRRGDPLCAACTQMARQALPGALWLFDSPLLRGALAQLNVAAVPAIIRAASGLSQVDLAAMAGWSRSALGLYEHGQRGALFDIRVLLQFADVVDMPREALLPLLLGDADAGPAADVDLDEAGVDLSRRSFGGLAASAAMTASPPGFVVPPRVSVSHVRYLQKCADALWSRDQSVGGAALLRSGLRQWHRARRMLRESSYTEAVGRELLAVTGRLGDCAGWLAFDSEHLALSRQIYAEAQACAEEASDSVLNARVLAQRSLLASYRARIGGTRDAAREALLLAYRATDEARYDPLPRLHALIAFRLAYAASLVGDEAAFRSGISRARHELDRGPRSDEPEWLRFVDDAEITANEAMGYLNLGDHGRSEALYRAALASTSAPRNQANRRAMLASSLLRQGALDQAVAEASEVLPALASGVTSVRTISELRPIRVKAKRPGDDEFRENFDAVERELTALRPVA